MTRDRALGGFALLVALAVIVLVLRPSWLPRRTVVHERTVTGPVTVVQSPPLTPLVRDSGPKNNPSLATRSAGSPVSSSAPGKSNTTTGARTAPLPVKKRQTPETTPTPRPSSQGQPQPHPAPSPPPSQPPPVVGVTAPVPATVCLRPAATVNC